MRAAPSRPRPHATRARALTPESATRSLPFLEAYGEDDEGGAAGAAVATAAEEEGEEEEGETTAKVFLNMGHEGISFKDEEGAPASDDAGKRQEAEEFAARRLSVHNPYDEDWNDLQDEEGEEAAAQ